MARSLTANQKAVPQQDATIAVEHTDAPIIRCTARKAFVVNNARIAEGETFYLVRSARRPGRYYVVHFSNERHQWQCSCGANCKDHEHIRAAKAHVVKYVVRPQVQKIEQKHQPKPAPVPAANGEHAYDISKPLTREDWKEIQKRDRARQKAEKAVDRQRIAEARAGAA